MFYYLLCKDGSRNDRPSIHHRLCPWSGCETVSDRGSGEGEGRDPPAPPPLPRTRSSQVRCGLRFITQPSRGRGGCAPRSGDLRPTNYFMTLLYFITTRTPHAAHAHEKYKCMCMCMRMRMRMHMSSVFMCVCMSTRTRGHCLTVHYGSAASASPSGGLPLWRT